MSEPIEVPPPSSHDATPPDRDAAQREAGSASNGNESSGTEQREIAAAKHTRRAFLFKLSLLLNAAVGTVLAVPLVGYLLGPVLKKDSGLGSWITLGAIDDFPVGQTRLAQFVNPLASFNDGMTAKTACWVRRVSQRRFQVFAINCAHLGCPVRWFPQSKLFLCPCHGGAYYADGSRASGPPPRGLFQYRYRVNGDSLLIHAGQMPTLATQASCKPPAPPLVQITPARSEEAASSPASSPLAPTAASTRAYPPARSDQWPA